MSSKVNDDTFLLDILKYQRLSNDSTHKLVHMSLFLFPITLMNKTGGLYMVAQKISHHQFFQKKIALKIANEIRFLRIVKV